MSTSVNEATTSGTAVDNYMLTIATEIWSELKPVLFLRKSLKVLCANCYNESMVVTY
jgi:hypothetical protein